MGQPAEKQRYSSQSTLGAKLLQARGCLHCWYRAEAELTAKGKPQGASRATHAIACCGRGGRGRFQSEVALAEEAGERPAGSDCLGFTFLYSLGKEEEKTEPLPHCVTKWEKHII